MNRTSGQAVPVGCFALAILMTAFLEGRPVHSLRSVQEHTGGCKHKWSEEIPQPTCLDSSLNGVGGQDCTAEVPDAGWLWFRQLIEGDRFVISARNHAGVRRGGRLPGPVPPTNLRVLKRLTEEQGPCPCHGTKYSAAGYISAVVRIKVPVLPYDISSGSGAASLTLRYVTDCPPENEVNSFVISSAFFLRWAGQVVQGGTAISYVSNRVPALDIKPATPVTPPPDVFVSATSVFLSETAGEVKKSAVVDWAGSSFMIGLRAALGNDGLKNFADGDAYARYLASGLTDTVCLVGD